LEIVRHASPGQGFSKKEISILLSAPKVQEAIPQLLASQAFKKIPAK